MRSASSKDTSAVSTWRTGPPPEKSGSTPLGATAAPREGARLPAAAWAASLAARRAQLATSSGPSVPGQRDETPRTTSRQAVTSAAEGNRRCASPLRLHASRASTTHRRAALRRASASGRGTTSVCAVAPRAASKGRSSSSKERSPLWDREVALVAKPLWNSERPASSSMSRAREPSARTRGTFTWRKNLLAMPQAWVEPPGRFPPVGHGGDRGRWVHVGARGGPQ